MFEYWLCAPNALTRRNQWTAACQRLPPGLRSVEMQQPHHLRNVPGCWTNPSYFNSDQADGEVKRLAAELLDALYKEISRASPQAVIPWTRREDFYICEEDYAVLNSGLAELEPWSEEWLTYMDERNE